MGTDTIILVITNILVPIIVALIGVITTRRYKKDIEIMKLEHKNEIEKLDMQHKHQMELVKQQVELNLTGDITSKLFEEALSNEDVKRELHQGISSGIKKGRR